MFDTHKLNELGFSEMQLFKKKMAEAVTHATAFMPDCREKSIFITKLEEAIFFGAKAIAQKPENYSEIISY